MHTLFRLTLIALIVVSSFYQTVFSASDLLTPEENLWLKSRNNTIVVYPEKNDPPFSYQTPGGSIQGLSVDYLLLIAENVGAKVQYLTPRSRSQLIAELGEGKGDVAFLSPSDERDTTFLFTESYVTVPVVLVVRKDIETRKTLSLSDLSGKRVAMVEASAIEEYVRKNYPRVVIESVTDNEVGLQKIVLGEAEAAAIDAASLSYLLSKQVLSSVKVVGSTGLDYHPSFAMTKDKAVLQSILEKGLTQVSATDRELLTDKWVVLPGTDSGEATSAIARFQTSSGMLILYFLFGLGFIGVLILVVHNKKHFAFHRYIKKKQEMEELQEEVNALEDTSKTLVKELEQIKHMESEIKEKLDSINKP